MISYQSTSDHYFLNLKQNQIKMIKNRGYDVSSEEWILDENLTPKQFRKKLLKKYDDHYPSDYSIRKLMYSEYIKDSKSLFVYYVGVQGDKQIKVDSIMPFISKMTEEEKNGILIIDSILSPEAGKRLNIVTESKFQIFKEDELYFDLISSHMIDPHVIVTDPNIKNKLSVSSKNMNIIFTHDPVARYYHFTSGQIIYIKSSIDLDFLTNYHETFCIVV